MCDLIKRQASAQALPYFGQHNLWVVQGRSLKSSDYEAGLNTSKVVQGRCDFGRTK